MTSVMPLRLMIVVLICVELLQVVQCVDHDNIQRLRKKHKKGLDNGTLKKGDNTFLQNSIPNEAVAINEGLSDVGEFHIGGNPVAYEKCDDLLLRVSGDDDLVDESEYLDFLAFVTGGEISAPTFDDLEGVFASIFLQAACTEGSSCDGETGSIFLEGTYVSNPIIFLFCTRVLQEVTTTTSLTFGYTIRYDTDSISKDQLSGCLEVATINLLLDNFGCERSLGPAQGQSRQLGLRGRIGEDKAATHSSDSSVSSEEHMFMDLLLREEEDRRFLSGDMSMGPSSCDYSVHAEVPSILDLGCVPQVSGDSTIDCGLVRSSVSVEAPQLLEPFEPALRQNVTDALRDAINGDSFESFFPPECVTARRLGKIVLH